MRANIAKFHDMTKFMGIFISVQHKYAALKGQPASAILRIIFVKLLLWCFRTKQDLTAPPRGRDGAEINAKAREHNGEGLLQLINLKEQGTTPRQDAANASAGDARGFQGLTGILHYGPHDDRGVRPMARHQRVGRQVQPHHREAHPAGRLPLSGLGRLHRLQYRKGD